MPVRIVSEREKTCRLVCPWPGKKVWLESSIFGDKQLEGVILRFDARPHEEIIIREQ